MSKETKKKIKIESDDKEQKVDVKVEDETTEEAKEPVTEETSEESPEADKEETPEEAAPADEEKTSDESPKTDKEEDKFGADGKIHSGLFDKKKKEKKDPMKEKVAELEDRVKRQMAEFENFRKRTEKEKTQMFEVGAKSIIEKILPVVDNFERGLAGVDENTEDPFAQGMQMVYKQLMTSLEEAGVTPIEAVGQEFNPDFHNAVMHVEDDNFGENEVVEELQRGYQYHDTVVRHSMVKVAN